MIIILSDGSLSDGIGRKPKSFRFGPADAWSSPASGSSSTSASACFALAAMVTPIATYGPAHGCSERNTADARPPRSPALPCGEGRLVWLTDAFPSLCGRYLLPGGAVKTAVFAFPPARLFSPIYLILLHFMTWHGGCNDLASRRLGRARRAHSARHASGGLGPRRMKRGVCRCRIRFS